MQSFVVWLIVTILIVAVLYFGRGTLLQRKLKLNDLNLKAAIIFAAVLALIPAFFVGQLDRSTAVVPDGVAEDTAITAGRPEAKN